MEAVPRLPMLSFDLRVNVEVIEFGPKLKQYIRDHYKEDPELYANEIHQLEGLRSAAVRPMTDVTGCSTLKRYYCQLNFLVSRFPMHKDGEAAVKCSWKDVYANTVCSLSDISLEMVSILYNIGALHSQLGAADKRITAEGMKMSCTHFQCAAWAFQHVRDEYPQAVGLDLSPDMMSFMHLVCLAQAQECILEKSMMDNRKATIISKVAVQTVEYYKQALKPLVECPGDENSFVETMSSKLCKKWEKYLKFKISYHGSVALLYQGQQAEEQQKMGERVAYYQAAFDKLNEAQKLSKGLDNAEAINDTLTFTNDVVEGKRKAAKSENEFIYHEEVPHTALLADIKGASLVKGIAFNINDSEVSGPDIFARIVPFRAHASSSLYSEEKAKLLRKMCSMIEDKDEQLDSFLSTLQLDELTADMCKLPQELIDRCAALNAKPGAIQNLVDAMNRLSDIYQDVESMLTDIKEMLKEEQAHEKEYQQQLGKRPPSIAATDLTREAKKYQEAHLKASESNQTLHKAMVLHIANLQLLALPLKELERRIPSVAVDAAEGAVPTKEMHRLLGKVEDMRRQRSMLANQLRESVCQDDITRQVVTFAGESLQILFQQELQKHQRYVTLIEQNLLAQDNILKALMDAYTRYGPTRRNTGEVWRRRETMIASLIASHDAYEDLITKSSKGLDFYKKLETNVSKLLQRVKGTVKVQQEEREQMMKSVRSSSTMTHGLPSGSLKLKDYLNIKKETGKLSLEYSTASSMNPYYSDATPPQNWIPGVRPAPVGSEETESENISDSFTGFYQSRGRDQTWSSASYSEIQHPDEKLKYQLYQGDIGGSTSHMHPADLNVRLTSPAFSSPNNSHYSHYQADIIYPHFQTASGHTTAPAYSSTYATSDIIGEGPYGVHPLLSGYSALISPSKKNFSESFAATSNDSHLHPPSSANAYLADTKVLPPASSERTSSVSSFVPPAQDQRCDYELTPGLTHLGPATYGNSATPVDMSTAAFSLALPPGDSFEPSAAASGDSYAPRLTHIGGYSMSPSSGRNCFNPPPSQPDYTPLNPSGNEGKVYGVSAEFNRSALSASTSGLSTSNTCGSLTPSVCSYAIPASLINNYIVPPQEQSNPRTISNPASSYPAEPPGNKEYIPSQFGTASQSYCQGRANTASWNDSFATSPLGYEQYYQGGNLYTASQTTNSYATTNSDVYKAPDGRNYENQYFTNQYGAYGGQSETTSTYMQAGADSTHQAMTTTTYAYNDGKTIPSTERSNVDLLAGLDFNVDQSPLVPETYPDAISKQLDKEDSADVEKDHKVNESVKITEIALVDDRLCSLNLSKEASGEKSGGKESLADVEAVKHFVQEVDKFEKFVDGLMLKTLNGPTCLDLKWKEITELQEKSNRNQIISVARCYPMKNRCSDILPYDDSRVELPSTKDDYINASWIKDLTGVTPPFILTQAPLPSTYNDFWAMVLEQQVEVVICLVKEDELSGETYWPSEKGEELEMGRVRVSLQSSNVRSHWVERILSLCVVESRVTRVVVHLQLTAWPGSSFPASPGPFLSFTQEAINFFNQQRCHRHPIVVHCVAGVGRTGLFCLVAAALLDIQAGKGIPDLVAVSARISQSRKGCLRDREHLKFAYQTVLYFCQDLLMKHGILTSRSSFEDKKNKDGKCHTRHPSEDFLLGSPTNLTQLQSGIEKLGFDSHGERTKSATMRRHSACSRQSSISHSCNSSGRSSPNSLLSDEFSTLDPAAFTLKLEHGKITKHLKRRFIPESFTNRNYSAFEMYDSSSEDPFNRLDPLWTMKK